MTRAARLRKGYERLYYDLPAATMHNMRALGRDLTDIAAQFKLPPVEALKRINGYAEAAEHMNRQRAT